jgi:glycosyltransferase involved in cell wall biosynthesis
MPLVSVIIPAYNIAPYIGETLSSVFAQTFADYEVIVINDGSPDTVELERALSGFRDRIHYLKQENLGASAARNAGLQAARGEFIAFLDGDDLWLPNYLEEQIKFVGEHDCDLVCADATMFGETAPAGKTYMEWLMETAPAVGTVSFRELIGAERCLITSGVVARRRPLLEAGLFDESLRTAQDFDLWLRLANRGARLMYHRTVLLRYRCHAGGLTGSALNSIHRELRVLEKVENDYALSPEVICEAKQAVRARRAILEFELGKLLIAQGEVSAARIAFQKAWDAGRSWKGCIAHWGSRLTPRLMRVLYLWKLQAGSVK